MLLYNLYVHVTLFTVTMFVIDYNCLRTRIYFIYFYKDLLLFLLYVPVLWRTEFHLVRIGEIITCIYICIHITYSVCIVYIV